MSKIPEGFRDNTWYTLDRAATIAAVFCHGVPFKNSSTDSNEHYLEKISAVAELKRELRATGKVKTDEDALSISEYISGHDLSAFLKQKGITENIGETFERPPYFSTDCPSWCVNADITGGNDSHTRAETLPDISPEGVTVTLPHMNKALEALFKVMWDNWKDPDPRRWPKQDAIARDIDAAMGWKTGQDGTPSRNAKAWAVLIKPD